jgi:hypothetical protein
VPIVVNAVSCRQFEKSAVCDKKREKVTLPPLRQTDGVTTTRLNYLGMTDNDHDVRDG